MNFGEEAPASVGHLVSDPNGMAINAVRTEGPANRIFNNTVPVLYGLSRAYSHQHHADAVLAGRTDRGAQEQRPPALLCYSRMSLTNRRPQYHLFPASFRDTGQLRDEQAKHPSQLICFALAVPAINKSIEVPASGGRLQDSPTRDRDSTKSQWPCSLETVARDG